MCKMLVLSALLANSSAKAIVCLIAVVSTTSAVNTAVIVVPTPVVARGPLTIWLPPGYHF